MLRINLFLAFFLSGQLNATTATTSPSETIVEVNDSFRYELFTSDVNCWITGKCYGPVSNYPKRELAKKLERRVLQTRSSLEVAAFGLRNQEWFVSAVNTLRDARAKIRVTIDQLEGEINDWSTTANFIYPDAIKLVNLIGQNNVRADVNRDGSVRTGSLMHHKFFVSDSQRVWFGSTNLSETETGSEYNANVSILVDSAPIASFFLNEFNQMFDSRKYSIYKVPRTTINTMSYLDGTKIKVLFAPQENPVEDGVIPFIKKAKRSLDIGIFYLTDVRVSTALIAAHNRGVKVQIINDATAAHNQYSQNSEMRAAGIDVRVENWGGKMHMKTAVRDHKDSLIGSANWTQAGNDDNDEHLVIIENNVHLARDITKYFSGLWDSLPTSLTPNYREPRAEGPDSINSCFDGIDNDHQGGADQEARACR